jgi:CRISPR-associated protein Csm2
MADFISIFNPLPGRQDIKNGLRGIPNFSEAPLAIIGRFPAFAAAIANEVGNTVTPTQLRRFYTYIKSIEMVNRHSAPDEFKDRYKLGFILPKIAGSSERDKLKPLYDIIKECLPKITTVSDLRIFVEFFEAILDYHASIPRNNS